MEKAKQELKKLIKTLEETLREKREEFDRSNLPSGHDLSKEIESLEDDLRVLKNIEGYWL